MENFVLVFTILVSVVVISFFISFVLAFKDEKNSNQKKFEYFGTVYTEKSFYETQIQSNNSKKDNSPFIKNENALDTVSSGVENVLKMFEGVGDCDERPDWQ